MNQNTHEDEVEKLKNLIKSIKVAMLTTLTEDGQLHSRPMATNKIKDMQELWFFTQITSPKALEIKEDGRVNLAYSDASNNTYVSLTGRAQIIKDQAKINELWTSDLNVWFPKGKEDPEVGLIRIIPESAQYWNYPNGAIAAVIHLVKKATGQEDEDTLNKAIKL